LLGKILRVDVDSANSSNGQYGVPADNPFVGVGGGVREEIYAYGFRNPWRVTFDDGPGGTGRLIVADVGQNLVEEIDLVEKGGNYGWRVKEGTFTFDGTAAPNPVVPLIDPVAQYAHPGANNGLQEFGISITGGEMYRGSQFPALSGKYIFGDFSTAFNPANGVLLGMEETAPGVFGLAQLNVVGGNPIGRYVTAFGKGEDGEIYVATKTTLAASGRGPLGEPTGAIFHLVAVPEPSALLLAGMAIACGMMRSRRPRSRNG
jgi:glucose/arabinose dehydrogenase